MRMLNLAVTVALAVQLPSGAAAAATNTMDLAITTRNPVAERYFDQGLQHFYSGRYAEAVTAFRTARQIDPTCAMCHWGEALALGPTLGRPMDARNDSAAQAAIRSATRYASRASSHERAYIRALARRYGSDAIATRSSRDTAYARAMAEIEQAFPEDPDAAVLHAEAQLLLADGAPTASAPNVRTALSSLTKVVEESPDHSGACRVIAYFESATGSEVLPQGHRCRRLAR